jgi:hypothetical protein
VNTALWGQDILLMNKKGLKAPHIAVTENYNFYGAFLD